jgi:hypothetical protein
MKKNLQRFGASVLAAAMVAKAWRFPQQPKLPRLILR